MPKKSFEYAQLDDKTREIVWLRTNEIKNLMRLTAENIIDIGHKLTEVKEKIDHGKFQKWLRSEFEWSEQTARQFMQVYRWSQTLKNKNFVFSRLSTSALYLLAAPSTPTQAREEILGLIEDGEKVSYSCVKNIVNRSKKTTKLESAVNNDEVVNTIDVRVESQIEGYRLFRLETSKLGCIVKLYRVEELEVISDLTIDATVIIKVGRWQGQQAKIIEILSEQQLSKPTVDAIPSVSILSSSNIKVRTIDESDFAKPEKLKEIEQNLIVAYGKTYLAINASTELLSAFIKRIETDLVFVDNILNLANC